MVNYSEKSNDNNLRIESNYQYVLNYKLKKFEDSSMNYWDINIIFEDINKIKTTYNYQEFKLESSIDFKKEDLTEEDKFNLQFDFNYKTPESRFIGWLNHWNQTNYYVIFTL